MFHTFSNHEYPRILSFPLYVVFLVLVSKGIDLLHIGVVGYALQTILALTIFPALLVWFIALGKGKFN